MTTGHQGAEDSIHGQSTILIVDDDPIVLAVMTALLRRRDCHVVTAPDAETALAVAEKTPLRLLITDKEMPGMDGVGLFLTLRRRVPLLRGILVSAYVDAENVLRIAEAGFHAVHLKPLGDHHGFVTSVMQQLEQAESWRNLIRSLLTTPTSTSDRAP